MVEQPPDLILIYLGCEDGINVIPQEMEMRGSRDIPMLSINSHRIYGISVIDENMAYWRSLLRAIQRELNRTSVRRQ